MSLLTTLTPVLMTVADRALAMPAIAVIGSWKSACSAMLAKTSNSAPWAGLSQVTSPGV